MKSTLSWQRLLTELHAALPLKPISAAIDSILYQSRNGDISERSMLPDDQGNLNRTPIVNQSDITRALLRAQDRDRKRIASDLHDSIGQNLSVVKVAIETVLKDMGEDIEQEQQRRTLTTAIAQVRIIIDELRRIALDLRPSMLEDLGLLATLDWLCREFTQSNPAITVIKDIQVEESAIPPAMRCDLFRVIQEALHNVTKHACAQRVVLSLHRDEQMLLLEIMDDGCGFNPRKKMDAGIGLCSIQARSERVGGELLIDSGLGQGTTIKACFPLPEDIKVDGNDEGSQSKRRRHAERRKKERRGKRN